MSIYRCGYYEIPPQRNSFCCSGNNSSWFNKSCSGLSGWLSGIGNFAYGCNWNFPLCSSNLSYINFYRHNSYCCNQQQKFSPWKFALGATIGFATTIGLGALVAKWNSRDYVPYHLRENNQLGANHLNEETINPNKVEKPEKEKANSDYETVKNILKEAGIEDENIIKAVAQKYPTMKEIPSAGLTVNDRVINFAKGIKFQNFSFKAAVGKDVEYDSDCSRINDIEKLPDAYKQFGKEYVEFYDKDNDGKINCYEMFYEELIANYIQNGFAAEEAKEKAIEITEKYREKEYNLTNTDFNDGSIEATLFSEILNKISYLETKATANIDTQLDSDEAALFLLGMAYMQDNQNNIKDGEYRGAEIGILFDGCKSIEDVLEKAPEFSEEEALSILEQVNQFNTNVEEGTKLLELKTN